MKDFTHPSIGEDKLTAYKEAAQKKSPTLLYILDILQPFLFIPTTEEHKPVVTKSIKLLRLLWKTDIERAAETQCESLRVKLSDLYNDFPDAVEALKKENIFRECQGDGQSTVGSINGSYLSALSDVGSPRREGIIDDIDYEYDLTGRSETASASDW